MSQTTMQPVPTKEQIAAYLALVRLVADTVKELKEVPHGALYVAVMSVLSLDQLNKILDKLVSAKLVTISNHVIRWALAD